MSVGWSRMRPWLLGLALLALVNLAVAVALTLPQWRAARASGAAERVNQRAQEIIEPSLQRARRVYGRVRDAEQELAELRRRVAGRSGSVSEVVSTVRAAVDASGLRPERISYQAEPIPALGLTQLQIALPVRGQYAQLRTFLDALMTGPIFVVVERIGASTPGSSDVSGQLLLNVVLSAFIDGELTGGAPEPATATRALAETPGPPVTAATDPVVLAQQLQQRLASLPEIPLPAESFALRLERLDVDSDIGGRSSRNLFAFANLPPPPPTIDPDAERERRERRRAARPPEPVHPYDLLGVIRTERGLIATIADDSRVFNVGEGDLLPAGYRVTRVGLVDLWLQVGRREVQLSLRKDEDEVGRDPQDGLQDRPQDGARRPGPQSKTERKNKIRKRNG